MSQGWNEGELVVRVTELEARMAELVNEIADVTTLVTSVPVVSHADGQLRYQTLDDWVREYFAPTFGRPVGGEIRWCAQWSEHGEAVGRLEALWRPWETLRIDAAIGMAMWLTNYLDPQLAMLFGRGGPFSQCSPGRHEIQDGLPL